MNSAKITNSDQEQTDKRCCSKISVSRCSPPESTGYSLFRKYSCEALKSCGKKNFQVQEGMIITGTKQLKYRNQKAIQG